MAGLVAARDFVRRTGPRVRDLVVLGAAVITQLIALFGHPRWSSYGWPVILLAGGAGTVALWWRRQAPIPVTIIGMGAFLLSANFVPLTVGLFTTAVSRRDRALVVLAGFVAVVYALPDYTDGGPVNPGALLSGILQAGFLIAAGSYIGARHDLLASLRERAERAEAERELRADQARAGERSRIAREMHDVLAHKVSLIALHAGALEVAPDAGPAKVEETAALIRTTARQTLEELRQVLGVLRSEVGAEGADLAPQAQAADIERLIDASRAAGVTIELQGPVPALPDATARAVYRVVQEGLTNIHKHARGAATVVAITGDAGHGVTVSVVNRRPVAADQLLPGSGSGLVGLSERMRLIGGSLRSGPSPEGGWLLEAWLPWSAP